MQITTEQTDAFMTAAGLVLLGFAWVKFWQPTALARFRQEVFDLRDEFFDSVAEGVSPFSFKDEGYKTVREDLNRMIRFSKEVGLIQIVLTQLFMRRYRPSPVESLNSASDLRSQMTEEQLFCLKRLDDKQSNIVFLYLIRSSPLMWFGIGIAAVWVLLSALMHLLRSGAVDVRALFNKQVVRPIIRTVELQADQKILVGDICRVG